MLGALGSILMFSAGMTGTELPPLGTAIHRPRFATFCHVLPPAIPTVFCRGISICNYGIRSCSHCPRDMHLVTGAEIHFATLFVEGNVAPPPRNRSDGNLITQAQGLPETSVI